MFLGNKKKRIISFIFKEFIKSLFSHFISGQIVDIILIATQTVGPSDGSHYIINSFGPGLIPSLLSNDTYRMPQPNEWQEL